MEGRQRAALEFVLGGQDAQAGFHAAQLPFQLARQTAGGSQRGLVYPFLAQQEVFVGGARRHEIVGAVQAMPSSSKARRMEGSRPAEAALR